MPEANAWVLLPDPTALVKEGLEPPPMTREPPLVVMAPLIWMLPTPLESLSELKVMFTGRLALAMAPEDDTITLLLALAVRLPPSALSSVMPAPMVRSPASAVR